MGYFNFLSFALSRLAFVATHLVFLVWVNAMLNDPFSLSTLLPAPYGAWVPTLDAKTQLPADKCTPLNKEHLVWNIAVFSGWWLQHSIMARKAFKVKLGLWHHPLERPLFATGAWLAWGAQVLFWKPVTDCQKWNPLTVSLPVWAVSGTIIVLATLLVVGFLWWLPDHVFGTARYSYKPGTLPTATDIIRGFPYGIVRHPAATGFLWMYWALPAYTYNHILLASLWTVFIVVGTLVFEEGGLRGPDEFGKKYAAYASEVAGLYPKPSCVFATLFGGSKHKPARAGSARASPKKGKHAE